MSWIYSLIFAGLVLAAETGSIGPNSSNTTSPEPPAVVNETSDVEERFEQTYPLTPDGRVRLQNVNGSIEVEAWDRNEVHVVAIKSAETAEALKDLEIDIKARPDAIYIEANHRGADKRPAVIHPGRGAEIRFYLKVPKNAVLDEIATVNGSIKIHDMANAVKVSAVNGSITASNLSGSTVLETVNGAIAVGFGHLSPSSKIALNTVNGRLSVTLPTDAEATVKATTLNGRIQNSLGLRVRRGLVGNDLHGKIGDGSTQIRLNSISGAITINGAGEKQNKPAVDMLKDTEDASDDIMSGLGVLPVPPAMPELTELDPKAQEELKKALAAAKVHSEQARVRSAEALKKAQEAIARNKEAFEAQTSAMNAANIARLSKLKDLSLARMYGMNWTGSAPTLHQHSGSFEVKGKPKITVTVKGASVSVRSWDRSEVKYVVSETAKADDGPRVDVKEERSGDDIKITIEGDDEGSERLPRVRVDVMVPRKADVRIKSDGQIRVDSISGNFDLSGRDDAIDVRDSSGSLSINTFDGRVRVIGFNGDLRSTSRDGDVFLEGDFTSLSSKAIDGTVTLLLSETANAKLISTTPIKMLGSLASQAEDRLELSFGTGGPTYNFEFVDGSLLLRGASDGDGQ